MTEKDITELANVIWHEARGESEKGQIAVGHVVLNRVRDPRYPNTIEGVVWQRAQFQNIRWYKQSGQLRGLARRILEGKTRNPIANCLSFRSNSSRKGKFRIGNHVFF